MEVDMTTTIESRVIAVDFDGVIRHYDLIPIQELGNHDWENDLRAGPIEGAFSALKMLVDSGYKVVIFTSRVNHDRVREWADRYPEGSIIRKLEITNVKPIAMAYIDDRGIRFTNWPDMLKYFM